MAGDFTTTLEWSGSVEVGQHLSSLVPSNVSSELTIIEQKATLTVTVIAEDLEQLREIVDGLLTLFSDQD
jgi:hypothetical protein